MCWFFVFCFFFHVLVNVNVWCADVQIQVYTDIFWVKMHTIDSHEYMPVYFRFN